MSIATVTETFTLEDFLANPPAHQEWVNGKLVETTTTVKHSYIQSRLSRYWANYINQSGQRGETLIALPCRTVNQGRRPDVSYLTPELLEQFGEVSALPQSPPLIAEVATLTDSAEDLFAKASEYLDSGCQEVWLLFPESIRVLIITQNQTLAFKSGDVVSTQIVLLGFSVAIDELLG